MSTIIKPITVCIEPKNNKKTNFNGTANTLKLDGQIEVKNDCLKYFHGCWIKAIKKRTREYNSGGFLTKIEYGIAYLRSIQNTELIELQIDAYKFFVKKDNEQYIAMQQIELEKERNKLNTKILKQKAKVLAEKEQQLRIFEQQKKEFERVKDKFFKLFQEGKAKILI